jgi:5'-nucleotidase
MTLPSLPRPLLPGLAALAAALLVALLGLRAEADRPPPQAAEPARGLVKLRLLGVNDFHGHLEPPAPNLGGAAWLTAHLDAATLPGRTIRVHAGDMVGASPLISSWFHDEPSIEAANAMGFDVGTLGNHEFDEGLRELLRLLHGGQRTGPEALKRDAGGELVNTSSPSFAGARFPYVSANAYTRDGKLVLPPYAVVQRAGVRVGFIGVTTTSTPKFLVARYAEQLRFTDISEAVNRWVPALRRRGVEAIVVLAHEGAPSQDSEGQGGPPTGRIVREAAQMSDEVDVVVAGHSHSRLDLRLPNRGRSGDKLIVEAGSYGTAYDRVDLTIDRSTGEVVAKSAAVRATRHSGVSPDARTAALVSRYRRRIAPLAEHRVGSTAGALTRANGRLGQLVADAQRASAGTDVALVNSGSLRGDIAAGPITFGALFEAQPYDHRLMRLELSGRALNRILERGGAHVFLAGARPPLDPSRRYSVAVNELFAKAVALSAGRGGPVPMAGTEVGAAREAVQRRGGGPGS